jgi:hypothetical protein
MRSVALALGWELYWRNRLWFALTLAYLGGAAVVLRALQGVGAPGILESAAGIATLPLLWAALALLAAFTYAQRADLAAGGTGFPARLFTAPVGTAALVGWPMLYGALAAALLWLATALLVLRPCGLEAPLAWPALLCAAFLAWLQAVSWWPFGWAWLRVAVAVLLLGGLVTVALLLGAMGPLADVAPDLSEWAAAAVLAALLPPAYAAAVAGVRRARRGDCQSWPSPFRGWAGALTAPFGRRRPFASPAGALLWWEWRRHGLGLPAMMALTLPWVLLPTLLPGQDELFRRGGLAVVLFLPVLDAVAAGTSLGNMSYRPAPHVGPFLATRPVSAAALVAAKLKVAALSTLAALALLAVVLPVALLRADVRADVAELWGALLRFYPPGKASAVVAVLALALPALTWKGLVGNLHVTLAGRPWVNWTATAAGLLLLAGGSGAGYWAYHHPEAHATLWRLAWWGAAAAVALKLLVGGWAVRALYRRRLVPPRALAGWLAVWLLAALALFAALAWLLPPGLMAVSGCAFAAVLLVPLARLALAPLALEWNRHR